MKVLLLTDVPPCEDYTGGLVLKRLCGFLPEGTAACFVVENPELGVKIDPSLAWMPNDSALRPKEAAPFRNVPLLHPAAHFIRDTQNATFRIGPIVDRVCAFGRANGIDRLWAVLQGPTMFRVATRVAKELGVPLLSQVYDPPDYWIIAFGLDPISARRAHQDYEDALRASTRCAAASDSMAEAYHRDFGINTVPLVPSIDRKLSYPPATAIHDNDELVIGMAGQIYAKYEWDTLLTALGSVGWTIAGRKVKLRLLGLEIVSHARTPQNIEFLGWRPQAETLAILSESDVNYVPYRFAPEYEVEARLCFPSKLTSYLSVGRPVLFHGPDYSSPAQLLERYDAGLRCYTMNPADLVSALTKLVENPDEYARLARASTAAYLENFTLETYHRHFAEFLGVDESELCPLDA